VISPYPRQYEQLFQLRSGKEVLLRPIRPEDEPMEKEMIASFSRQTQYFRFFGFLGNISKELLIRSTQIDYDREIAIIAELEEEGKKTMAAEVRLLADADNERAEFAIVVADAWQGQGLGRKMMDYIIEIAVKRGIRIIHATVLRENKRMTHMFRQRGFRLELEQFTTYYAELELEKEEVG
jgi:acetyltransferase